MGRASHRPLRALSALNITERWYTRSVCWRKYAMHALAAESCSSARYFIDKNDLSEDHFFKRKIDHFLGSSQALILTSSRARFFSIFFQLFFRKISENFTKNSWKISSKKWPPRAYTPGRPPFSYKISQTLFLYINPYDTCEFLKKSEKSALFGIPFHENFSLDENFGLNPVWKKLWLGGESYKWAKKGLHRAFFIEISLLRWTNGLWLRLFFRPTGSIFLTSQNFAKIFCHFFLKISWFFWQKNAPQGDVFLMIFWSLSEAIFWAIFLVIFSRIFRRFFREFLGDFFCLRSMGRDPYLLQHGTQRSWATHQQHELIELSWASSRATASDTCETSPSVSP